MPNDGPIASGDTRTARTMLELRHARLRVELAAVTLDWAAELLATGKINDTGALALIDEAFSLLDTGADGQ